MYSSQSNEFEALITCMFSLCYAGISLFSSI